MGWPKGYKMSDAQKAAISRGRKGIKFSEGHRANLAAAGRGKTPWNKGKSCSDAQKEGLKQLYAGRARTLYGRDGAPSPALLSYAWLCVAGYKMDVVTVPLPTGSAYLLDFALLPEMVNIEINGPSHKERTIQDKRRDDYLRSLGWKVIRISV
ncbi:MAG: DUF559 domain-containing protein [Bryobacteraceae bacterium]